MASLLAPFDSDGSLTELQFVRVLELKPLLVQPLVHRRGDWPVDQLGNKARHAAHVDVKDFQLWKPTAQVHRRFDLGRDVRNHGDVRLQSSPRAAAFRPEEAYDDIIEFLDVFFLQERSTTRGDFVFVEGDRCRLTGVQTRVEVVPFLIESVARSAGARAVERALEEVAEEFGGEDPAHPILRQDLEEMKEALQKLHQGMGDLGEPVELTEPGEDRVDQVRELLQKAERLFA